MTRRNTLGFSMREKLEFYHEPEPNTGCWLWTGTVDRKGYGALCYGGRCLRAHRLAYEEWRNEIPGRLTLDHLCRVRSCINPWHLEPVAQRENVLRGKSPCAENAKKTHCKRGHEFCAANTRLARDGKKRECRACDAEKARNRSRSFMPNKKGGGWKVEVFNP